jgi:hypothetical protein
MMGNDEESVTHLVTDFHIGITTFSSLFPWVPAQNATEVNVSDGSEFYGTKSKYGMAREYKGSGTGRRLHSLSHAIPGDL